MKRHQRDIPDQIQIKVDRIDCQVGWPASFAPDSIEKTAEDCFDGFFPIKPALAVRKWHNTVISGAMKALHSAHNRRSNAVRHAVAALNASLRVVGSLTILPQRFSTLAASAARSLRSSACTRMASRPSGKIGCGREDRSGERFIAARESPEIPREREPKVQHHVRDDGTSELHDRLPVRKDFARRPG
ncbi:MAG: hypothetical protein O3B31_05045 [Chloroflexi bacterium]|nr:hypothetical protein [Chloroflexota bacterium]